MKPAPDDIIYQRIVELSRDPDLIEKLTLSFAPSILGHRIIKLALLLHLVGGVHRERNNFSIRDAIHVLLIGDPGTGKTSLLRATESLCDTVSVTGTGVNVDGLAAFTSTDPQGSPMIHEGVLVKADQRHLHVDKLDKMSHESRSVLEYALDNQFYPYSKNGVTKVLDTRVSVLATSNPCLGRFNPYQTVAQNINLPVGLLSCFDLIYILRDEPDEARDRVIAEKILELDPDEGEAPITHPLLKAYLEKAASLSPSLSREAKTRLRDFHLDIRRASDQGDAISITPRQLLSLTRLCEASAKLHHRENVSESDVEFAVSVFSESLEQVGVDPVTHHYDVDVLYTGRPTVLNSKLLKVVEVFSELEKNSLLVKETDLQYSLFERYGFNRRTVSRLLRSLIQEDIITSPSNGYYKRREN